MPNSKRLWVLGGLVSLWAVAAVAQQKVMSPQDQARFTGYSLDMEETGIVANRRSFDAGSYTAWHSHDQGQLLYVETGRMRIQRRGERSREIGPHETDYTGPGVIHWHGALPGQPLQQVGVTFGGDTRWMEKVTAQQYGGR
jgi:quercetin dioxygenase-like cupin family protein